MTWPTGATNTTNCDSDTDNPAAARPNILDAPAGNGKGVITEAQADGSPLAWNPDDSVKPWSADQNKLSWTPLLGRRQKSEEHR